MLFLPPNLVSRQRKKVTSDIETKVLKMWYGFSLKKMTTRKIWSFSMPCESLASKPAYGWHMPECQPLAFGWHQGPMGTKKAFWAYSENFVTYTQTLQISYLDFVPVLGMLGAIFDNLHIIFW